MENTDLRIALEVIFDSLLHIKNMSEDQNTAFHVELLKYARGEGGKWVDFTDKQNKTFSSLSRNAQHSADLLANIILELKK